MSLIDRWYSIDSFLLLVCICLMFKPFIDVDVPLNSYAVAQTEWTNTKSVSTLYISQNTSNEKFIPILITIQEEVDQNAMLEAIEHPSPIYENSRALSIVLTISKHGEFSAIDNSFLIQCKSKFWAINAFCFFFAAT
ncbi:hypothetical protein BY458DRAFT_509937 [Sporodiniella umbellata]|nr:hypothetical protein BY458DRAFT_509937 [Sporodiniella umbellata]